MKLKVLFQDAWTVYAVASDAQGRDHCQIEDFFCTLEADCEGSADGMLQVLDYVAANGPRQLSDSLSHYIDQQERIFEFIKGKLRIVWFYDDGKCVICTHGFVKDSQKTRQSDKTLAIKARKQYFKAKEARALTIIR